MLIIGTAGHIDHGKSSIVQRLTGTDPDRLPEEKARGMTIDLGFAFYKTPTDDTIAFVDVPGHERFVKNMVAGVGGIDVVMLVIAADDGWMPQSQEHFDIVRLLNVKNGLVVVNKIDLVEPDWVQLLESEVREKVKGSFLENAPIFAVSAQTGSGFKELTDYLNQLPDHVKGQKDIGKARLYIDRSFVRPGIGGVVTGTLRGGTLSVGQQVGIWPSGKSAKIRTLHSNNRNVETAVPGQRTAVSFTGIDKEMLVRGGVVCSSRDISYFRDNPVAALSVEMLNDAEVPLTDRRRVLVIVGTSEIEGEVRIYSDKQISPGGKGIVFFRPDDPMLSFIGDRFILRLPTPMVTLGGGQVLDHFEHFPRKRDYSRLEYLQKRLPVSVEQLVLSELQKNTIVPVKGMLSASDFSANEVESVVKDLWSRKKIRLFEECAYDPSYLDVALSEFKSSVAHHLEENPHLKGLTIDQLMVINKLDQSRTELLTRFLIKNGEIVKTADKYNLLGRGMSLKGPVKSAHDDIIAILRMEPYAPPNLLGFSNKGKSHKEAIGFILETGEGYKCGADFIFLAEVWNEVVSFVKDRIATNGSMSVADLKERFGFSRKYAIPILEETDRIRLTKRDGDVRVKGARFDDPEFAL